MCEYEQYELIGSGSYGSVHLGEVKDTRENVAIKIINIDIQSIPLVEIDIMSRLRHPNLMPSKDVIIPQVCPSFLKKNEIAISMPLAKNMNGTLSVSNMFEACDGLSFLHERGYLHLDISPDNILLLDGEAVISDFGISRKTHSISKTVGMYKADYSPPDDIITYKSDIWALGLTFNVILGESAQLSPEMGKLLDGMLDMNQEERWGWKEIFSCDLFSGMERKEGRVKYPDVGTEVGETKEEDLEITLKKRLLSSDADSTIATVIARKYFNPGIWIYEILNKINWSMEKYIDNLQKALDYVNGVITTD